MTDASGEYAAMGPRRPSGEWQAVKPETPPPWMPRWLQIVIACSAGAVAITTLYSFVNSSGVVTVSRSWETKAEAAAAHAKITEQVRVLALEQKHEWAAFRSESTRQASEQIELMQEVLRTVQYRERRR